jgi:hypothetical protein
MEKRWLVPTLIVMVAVSFGLFGAQARATSTTTATVVLSTATNQIIPGANNSGWWSPQESNTNANDIYFVGNCCSHDNHNFFTFSFSSVTNPCGPVSAYLTVPRGTASGPSSLTYRLFDVSTAATVLNTRANNPNSTIYADLGSGTTYGTYSLSTAGGPAFTLPLNSSALAALGAAQSAHAAWFSIGGALIGGSVGNFLFGSTSGEAVTLTLNFPKLCRVS